MKVGFSARGLSVQSGGARQYIESIIPALARNIGRDELFVFYNDEKYADFRSNIIPIVIDGDKKLVWDFVLLPRMMKRIGIDVMIFPKNVIPFNVGCSCYAVVHDLAHFVKGLNAYPLLDGMYMRTMIPRSMRRATGIFAVSVNTKRDIIRYTRCRPDKITVTYEAADEKYGPIEDEEILSAARNKLNLPDKFILYPGSLSPRKNITRLLEAFSLISVPHSLVLTASKSWKDGHVYKTIKRLGLSSRIVKLRYVAPEYMPVLYNLADVLVYPSLYEGFGLPILEAMQCGCPVVASTATSIPEVAGIAAMLINPSDVGALSRAIHSVLTDKTLRKVLISLGLIHARRFSWSKTAEIMLKVIRKDAA